MFINPEWIAKGMLNDTILAKVLLLIYLRCKSVKLYSQAAYLAILRLPSTYVEADSLVVTKAIDFRVVQALHALRALGVRGAGTEVRALCPAARGLLRDNTRSAKVKSQELVR